MASGLRPTDMIVMIVKWTNKYIMG
jgi:hypothetical protein